METLARYSEWLVSPRKAGWVVYDIHSAMTRYLSTRRIGDPNFLFATDGVHPGDIGHFAIARELLVSMGAAAVKDLQEPTQLALECPDPTKLFRLVEERQILLRDAWLSQTKHLRPGVQPGLPLAQAYIQATALTKDIDSLRKTK